MNDALSKRSDLVKKVSMINREKITLLSANKIARITIMVNQHNGESPNNYQNECNIEQKNVICE